MRGIIAAIVLSGASVIAQNLVPISVAPVRSVGVGKEPRRALINPQRNEVYVSNLGDGTVSIVGPNSNTTESIVIGPRAQPDSLALSKDGSTLFVGNHRFERDNDGAVAIIDTATRTISKIIHVDVLLGLPNRLPVRDLALSPDGDRIYLALEYGGLGKIDLKRDYSLSFIDTRSCPEAVTFCRTDAGVRAYVNYQCGPSPGTAGHDPIIIYDGKTDKPLTTVWQLADGLTKMPNVGGTISSSPDGKQVWASGEDACRRLRSATDSGGYDGEGCPAKGPGVQVINVIRTPINTAINTLNFPSWFLAEATNKTESGGASFISFFPDNSGRVAVGCGSELVIFDSKEFPTIRKKESIPIGGVGSLAFSPDGLYAFAPVSVENSLRVLKISMPAPQRVGAFWKWYSGKWKESPFKTASEHFSFAIILWGALSFSFAKTFASRPALRFLLDLEVYVRKARSRLARLYVSQLRQNLRNSLDKRGVKIVPLPLTSASLPTKTTTEWIDRFVGELALETHHRVLSRGRGGVGKTILLKQIILSMIDAGFVPLHFEAVNYEGDPSFESWTEKVIRPAQVPMSLWAWSALQNLVVNVIDQATEVPQKYQEAFVKLIRTQFSSSVANTRLVLAGRFGAADTGPIQDLQKAEWEDILDPNELSDDDIKRLGSAYLDKSGESEIIRKLPDRIKNNIMEHPTAFVVTHYVKARRGSARSVSNKSDLFREILDAHLQGGNGAALTTLPEVVKLILQRLVGQNLVRTGDRGLPLRELLVEQVGIICQDPSISRNFGQENVPISSDFVKRLLPSGLVYLASDRYLFFHDSFEDWLVDESEER